MNPGRVFLALVITAVLATGTQVLYLGVFADDLSRFAAFGLAKRILLPLMYCIFALMLVWPTRSERAAARPHLPVWWRALLAALVLSSLLSFVITPGPFRALEFLQGLALFGGSLLIAYAGLRSPRWTEKEKRNLVLLLVAVTAVALISRTTGFVPFLSVLVPSIGATLYLALRVRRYRVWLLPLAMILGVGLYIVTFSPTAPKPVNVGVLAEVAVTFALLLILCAPYALRRYVAIGVLIAGLCAVAAGTDYLPIFFGASDYTDVTFAHRGYETGAVIDAVFASPWTAIFGLGPGGVVDLSLSPDAGTLAASGRDLAAVPSVHILTSHMLLKFGLLGVAILGMIVLAILRQIWLAATRRDSDGFDGALLFYVVTGLASAIPAATNVFASPLPILFLAIVSARTIRRTTSPEALAERAAQPWPRRLQAAAVAVSVGLIAVTATVVADRSVNLLPATRGTPVIPGAWTEGGPLVVFLGDGDVAGTGITAGGVRFSTRIGMTEGWREINLGRGGTGYTTWVAAGAQEECGLDYCKSYREMLNEVALARPDIVFIDSGRSEISIGASPEWADGVRAFFQELRQVAPGAKIIVLSPIASDDGPEPETLKRMRAVVQQATESVGGLYIDLGQPLLGRPETLDQLGRLTPQGHAAIAEVVLAAL